MIIKPYEMALQPTASKEELSPVQNPRRKRRVKRNEKIQEETPEDRNKSSDEEVDYSKAENLEKHQSNKLVEKMKDKEKADVKRASRKKISFDESALKEIEKVNSQKQRENNSPEQAEKRVVIDQADPKDSDEEQSEKKIRLPDYEN